MDTDYRDRLSFAALDADKQRLLAEASRDLEAELPEALEAFYRHMRGWSQLTAMFDSEPAMDRARRAQGDHWRRLFSGRFDVDYVESVRRVGRVHSRIGLDPRWYLGGYSYLLGRLLPGLARRALKGPLGWLVRRRTERLAALMTAVTQAALLDMELAVSVYLSENKAGFDRKLAQMGADFEARIGGLAESVASAAAELQATASSMSAASGESNTRMMTVAAAAEQTSAGISTVASGSEQLAAAIRTINARVAESATATDRAVSDARRTAGIVAQLAEATETVGNVTDMISALAVKTNMLALNAAVEAARAGEAGRTFEVVASQVKELAGQTASQTELIGAQIKRIQASVAEAVAAIGNISQTIEQVAGISQNIRAAVDEQRTATEDMTRSIGQTAQATQQVSDNLVNVSHNVEQTGVAAQQMRVATDQLSDQAQALTSAARAFVADIRAAA
jgi:methyl-accepting chemotaxis protein